MPLTSLSRMHACFLRSPSACLVAVCSRSHSTTGQMRGPWSAAKPSQLGRYATQLDDPARKHSAIHSCNCPVHAATAGRLCWAGGFAAGLVCAGRFPPNSAMRRKPSTLCKRFCCFLLHAGVAGCEGAHLPGPAQDSQEAQVW